MNVDETTGVTNGELARLIARVEAKIDKVTEDHETRIRRVERVMYISVGLAATGATSGLSALIGALT